MFLNLQIFQIFKFLYLYIMNLYKKIYKKLKFINKKYNIKNIRKIKFNT